MNIQVYAFQTANRNDCHQAGLWPLSCKNLLLKTTMIFLRSRLLKWTWWQAHSLWMPSTRSLFFLPGDRLVHETPDNLEHHGKYAATLRKRRRESYHCRDSQHPMMSHLRWEMDLGLFASTFHSQYPYQTTAVIKSVSERMGFQQLGVVGSRAGKMFWKNNTFRFC
ncbi:hypothetical protein L218DRAFT_1046968 [Marasmius fiardii PR-910]|nr:hypothetical protein L218DRAFT_1046968 [Marasmius fiardii PR-910]